MNPGYRFCPLCGNRLESRLIKSGEPERLVCVSCGHVLYLDPKVAVGTIIADGDGRLALVRRAIEPGFGRWVFPGGYVDRGETPQAAARREAREECGLDVRLDGLVNVYAYPGRVPIILVYAASALGGTLCAADEECSDARWFAPGVIPWHDLVFPSTSEGLRDYLAGIRHPKL
jgi:ADP-ribose pyrophosphatase YjhB (NUDIX family)